MLTIDISKNKGAEQSQYEGLVTSLTPIALRALSLVDIKDGLEQLGYITQLKEAEKFVMVFLSTADGENVMPVASIALRELASV